MTAMKSPPYNACCLGRWLFWLRSYAQAVPVTRPPSPTPCSSRARRGSWLAVKAPGLLTAREAGAAATAAAGGLIAELASHAQGLRFFGVEELEQPSCVDVSRVPRYVLDGSSAEDVCAVRVAHVVQVALVRHSPSFSVAAPVAFLSVASRLLPLHLSLSHIEALPGRSLSTAWPGGQVLPAARRCTRRLTEASKHRSGCRLQATCLCRGSSAVQRS